MKGQGLCCGLRQKGDYPKVETLNGLLVPVIRLATAIVRQLFGSGFVFSSIQINANTVSEKHTDENYVNDSVLIVVGNFVGGEFVLDGMEFDLRAKALRFDGSRVHSSKTFSGERFSFVFFTHKVWPQASESMVKELCSLGFPLPNEEGHFTPGHADRDEKEQTGRNNQNTGNPPELD